MSLDWSVSVLDVPDRPLRQTRSASSIEREALQSSLDVPEVKALTVDYSVSRIAGGAYRVKGQVHGDVSQACVVSLEPVPEVIDETFEVEYWPESVTPLEAGNKEREQPILDGVDREAIRNGHIDIGRIVFEILSGALDPYPRKADAAFEWRDQEQEKSGKISPFAALSKIRDKEK